MAKKIVRYLLEGNGTVPAFVEDGGYWQQGAELVGKSVDEDSRHIPATVARMTRAELLARVTAVLQDEMGEFRLKPNSEEAYDADDAEAMTQAFLDQMDLSDYA